MPDCTDDMPPVEGHICPHCQVQNSAWCTSDGIQITPEAGALSMCFQCGKLAIFVDAHTPRVLTAEEEKKTSADPLVIRARKMFSYTESPRLATALMSMDT